MYYLGYWEGSSADIVDCAWQSSLWHLFCSGCQHVCLSWRRWLSQALWPERLGALHYNLWEWRLESLAESSLEQVRSQLLSYDNDGQQECDHLRYQSAHATSSHIEWAQKLCQLNFMGSSFMLPHLLSWRRCLSLDMGPHKYTQSYWRSYISLLSWGRSKYAVMVTCP
jgi:hypothetical protein